MSEEDRLAEAVELVKTGNRAEAQKIVTEIVQADRNNARAWILMAKIVDDPQKALECWQQVARLKPDDPRVQEEIAKLKEEPIPQTSQLPSRPIITPSFHPVAPVKQDRQISLLLLIGGGIAIAIVASVAGFVAAGMISQSNLTDQTTSTAGTATTVAEHNRTTDTDTPSPIPATALIVVVTATNVASADEVMTCPTAEPCIPEPNPADIAAAANMDTPVPDAAPQLPTAVGGGEVAELPTPLPGEEVGTGASSGALDTPEGTWGNYLRDMIAKQNQMMTLKINLLEGYEDPAITQMNLSTIILSIALVADRTQLALPNSQVTAIVSADFDIRLTFANGDADTRTCKLTMEMDKKGEIWYVLNPQPLPIPSACPN